ncbi:helix-turn-helix domain-containing protein [Mesobacillus zeae]|uniref:XRE family transcriptional regulator n=1 Tax=Mesobacillus zeae TaxID=1917180 RepID=A0A398B5L1_9BACI|nr:helix-turn-helix transcriptional regulator [Mesobacillus zeae]RID83230.1 XRE family transcriptional regulator [Mesobacillus zeae]
MITQEERDSLMRAMEMKHALVFCDGLPIGRQIRIKRAHDSLSLVQASEFLKIPKSTLSEIETGVRKVPRKHEKAINEYLYHMYFADGEFIERWEQ